MKIHKIFIECTCFFILLFVSCKKENQPLQKVANLNVINAIADATIKTNTTGKKVNFSMLQEQSYYYSEGLFNGGSKRIYGIAADKNVSVEVVLTTDTLNPIFNEIIHAKAGDSYSLFLSGNSNAVDATVVKDEISNFRDSVSGVRFVNLSSSGEVNINIRGQSNELVDNFAYRDISPMMILPAKSTNTSYVFEVRNQIGNILATYSYSTVRFKSVTLIIRGLVNGSPRFEVVRANNY